MSSSAESSGIFVEVAYADSARAVLVKFQVMPGTTLRDVLELAAARPEFAGIEVRGAAVGIFGRIALPDRPIEDGDRVEIYRPLALDPKTARRVRAQEARKKH